MKKEIKRAVTITAIFAVLYLVFAFITLEANPLKWEQFVRFGFCFFSFIGISFTFLAELENNKW